MKEEQKGKTLGQFREQVSSLEAEVTSLKHQLAGSKGRNKQLTRDVEKWKTYGKEADELYEKRLAEIDGLKSSIKEKDATIAGLESQISKMSETMREQSNRIECLKSDVGVAEANLEYYKSLPWYKKVFKR